MHLYNIDMRHIHYVVVVIVVRAHVSWSSLLHMTKWAQAISIHGQTVSLTVGPSTKQQTKNNYSGWSKQAARGFKPECDNEDRSHQWEDSKPRLNTMRRLPGPLRATLQAVRQYILLGTLREPQLQIRKLHGRDWENSIVCSITAKVASVLRFRRMRKRTTGRH